MNNFKNNNRRSRFKSNGDRNFSRNGNGHRMRFELNAVPLEKWIEKQERLNRFFVKGLESEFIIDDNKKEFDFILFY